MTRVSALSRRIYASLPPEATFPIDGMFLLPIEGETMLRVTLTVLFFGAGLAAAQAGFPCGKFSHDDAGTWHVLEPLTIEGPGGRKIDFTPNETYAEGHEKLGLDMAKLLNANCAKK